MKTRKQQARQERLTAKAEKLERRAQAQYEGALDEVRNIPLGQPILRGHHSERRHRKALERRDARAEKAFDTLKEAKTARARAAGAGSVITADDPEALDALRAKLTDLEAQREAHKLGNKLWRKGGVEAVREGLGDGYAKSAERTMAVAHWLKAPFNLTNLSATIRRTKARIEELEALESYEPPPPIEGDGYRIEEDVADVRVRFYFDERPSREVCKAMRSAGFRFSRTHGAWQRQLTPAGVAAAKRMAAEIFGGEA